MKRILFLLLAVILLAGCGTSKSAVAGKDSDAAVVFFADRVQKIDVTIDNKSYRVNTVLEEDYLKTKNLKKTARNMIVISPGNHTVKVRAKGQTILTQKIYVAPGDTKAINL